MQTKIDVRNKTKEDSDNSERIICYININNSFNDCNQWK